MSYREIVDHYIQHRRRHARVELTAFRELGTLSEAIKNASLCHWLPSHKRHPHQYRIPAASLELAERKLQDAKTVLGRCTTFEALHTEIERRISAIHMIGPLAIYDISHRIGAYLGLQPALVYLHRGTLAGARVLGFSGNTLDPASLPPAFTRLAPHEIEDCLCIYKDQLRSAKLAVRQRRSACMDQPVRSQSQC